MSAYHELKQRYETAHILDTIGAILMWDERVMMPRGSGPERIAMHQLLSDVSRSHFVSTPLLRPLLQDALLEKPGLSDWDQRNLDQMVEANDDPPLDIVPNLRSDLRAVETQCRQLWPDVRVSGDWSAIVKPFTDLIYYRRLLNTALATVRNEPSPYDISLSHFTRRWRTRTFDILLQQLIPDLKAFLAQPHTTSPPKASPLALAPATQQTIMQKIINDMGFDFEEGRLDIVASKAFFAKTDHDRRIVTRMDSDNALGNISSTVHETGHALHYQHLPEDWRTQPVGRAGDMCMREAVALFWQIYIGQTPEFYTYLSGVLDECAQVAISGDELYARQQYMTSSPLRVGSDPAHYALHIVIRYQIERDMINGLLDVSTLPQRWAYDYAQELGVAVPDNGRGCLQDIHWFKGSFGYFPCYLLALLYAAQLYYAAERDIPDLRAHVAKGAFGPVNSWLNDKIYRWANYHDGLTLLENATGEPLNPAYFIAYLHKRYA